MNPMDGCLAQVLKEEKKN